MKNFLFGSITALALLALPAMANPIIKVNDVANSSFHPAKMQLALPGIAHGLELGRQLVYPGIGEWISETGSAKADFPAHGSLSDFGLIEYPSIPEAAITMGNPAKGPISNLPTVPEPSTLALFGVFFMALWLRSRWATWHR